MGEARYRIGQLRGAYAAGAASRDNGPRPSPAWGGRAKEAEERLWDLARAHPTEAFYRDGPYADEVRALVAGLWAGGPGEGVVHDLFDRIEDRLVDRYGDFIGGGIAATFGHRIAEVMPWPA